MGGCEGFIFFWVWWEEGGQGEREGKGQARKGGALDNAISFKLASRASVIYHAPKYQPQVGFILSLRDRERSRSKHQNLFFFFIVVSVPASPPLCLLPP